jgi:acetyl esterase/lipase
VPFTLDGEVADGLAPLADLADATPRPMGDWAALRTTTDAVLSQFGANHPVVRDVSVSQWAVRVGNGGEVGVSWFTKDGDQPGKPDQPGSAAVYLHGGGMIGGSVAICAPAIRRYVSVTGVPILAVDYRLAPQHRHPTQVEDCYAALGWLTVNAGRLGVDPARIAVMGDSAGGGLAAGTALLARDRGDVRLVAQILIYPMLDSGTTRRSHPTLAPFLTWSEGDNATAWAALPRDDRDHALSFPGQAASLAGIAPAYLEVGELDLFRDEAIEYARRLWRDSTSVELIIRPGCPHAFDMLVPQAAVSARAFSDRCRRLRAL